MVGPARLAKRFGLTRLTHERTMDLASTQYGFWRVAEKVRRRALRLAGRPDNSPWVLEPRRQRRTAPADFIFALDYLSPNSPLLRMFHQAMGAYGLSVL